jgi:Protein of unknown function (DUF4240)
VELDEFWALIDAARSDGDGELGEDGVVLAKRLGVRLSALPKPQRARFGRTFADLVRQAATWDLFGAAYLIGGGCDDGGFEDFRFGLVAAGRDWYAQALNDADSLAGYPVVAEAAEWDDDGAVFAELVGDEVARATGVPQREPVELAGQAFDVDSDDAMRFRLPRLAALYLGWPANEGCRC